jgi:hypothetical protein
MRSVQQEQLGDLKLYRVPDRTTVASRQSKQVRLLDRLGIPVDRVFGADLTANQDATAAASMLLRTLNDAAHHLGLALPSGRIAVFADRDGQKILLHESGMRDLASMRRLKSTSWKSRRPGRHAKGKDHHRSGEDPKPTPGAGSYCARHRSTM